MSDIENEMIPVEIVLREGLCTPNCLLALESDDKNKCSCRCGGKYHGALADAYVVQGESNNWWKQEEVPKLEYNEYVDIRRNGVGEFNRIYRESYGRFGAVLRCYDSTYQVRFDFADFTPNGGKTDFDKIKKLMSALMMSKRITTYFVSGTGLDEESDLDPCVDISIEGIKNFDEAKVIHNVFLDFCYTPYGLNLDEQIERVKEYAKSELGVIINEDCTKAYASFRNGKPFANGHRWLCQDFPVLSELAAYIGDTDHDPDNSHHKETVSQEYESGFHDAMISVWCWCIDHRVFNGPVPIDDVSEERG